MIKSHEEEKVTTEVVVDDVICNCCGKPIQKIYLSQIDGQDVPKSFLDFDDYLEINKIWGYFSDYDNERHSFHICQSCYNKWINSFTIPVEIEEINYAM